MISAKSLNKTFTKGRRRKDKILAVKNVSFNAQDGEITGLLGANGAGKSTTLRMLVGLVDPDSGQASVDNFDTVKNKLDVRKSIGYLPHNSGIYPRLTARENIHYYARLTGLNKELIEQRTNELVDLLGLGTFIDRRTDGFSQGQKTKVALARALVHRPQNLILDEPTNGLDVVSTRKLRTILRTLKEQGHCILISSHVMQEISLLCDHVAIIHAGEVALEGSISNILEQTGETDIEEAFVKAIGESFEDA